MAFQSVPDTVEMIPTFQINGQEVTMTFYGRIVGGYDQSDVDALAAAGDVWADAELLPIISAQATYLGTATRGLENPIDYFAFANANAGAGGDATAPLPNVNAFAVSRRTGFTGRSARGRVYFPLCQSFISTNEDLLLESAANAIQLRLNTLLPAMAAVGFTEVLVSRYTGGVKRAFGLTTPITSYFWVDLTVDTQRRRAPGK